MRVVLAFLTLLVTISWSSLVCCQTAHTNNSSSLIVVDDNFKYQNVTQLATRVYAAKDVSFSSVRTHIEQWLPVVPLSPVPNDNAVWAKVSIQHKGQYALSLTLLASNINANDVEGYVVDEQDTIRRIYNQKPKHQNGHKIEFFLLPGESIDVYVSASDIGPTYLPLTLWEQDTINASLATYEWHQTLFVGLLLGLICYFFITYFVQRNAARFWFSISMTLCLVFVVQLQGARLSGLEEWINGTSLVLFCTSLALLAAAKVTHHMLPRITTHYRRINYALPVMNLFITLFLSTYIGLIASGSITVTWLLMQTYFCMKFKDRRQTLPSYLYACGWLMLAILCVVFAVRFLSETPPSAYASFAALLTVSTALMLAGVAIETGERGVRIREFTHQEKRIANLRQFYDLFRNSAEGLYTSTLQGNLLSVNPAMCQLFGYEDEESMLNQATSTSSFYAHPEDRQALLADLLETNSVLGREIRGKRRDGSEFWFSISCQIHREGGEEFLYGSIFDVTERKQSSLSLEYLATHDSLTGVLNRREFERKLQHILNHHNDMDHLGLLYLDLDRFKLVNDSCGHQAGDELIKDIATLIHDMVGNKGEVARLGGDEFAVLCNELDEDETFICANKLLHAIQDYRFFYENKIFTLGVSIGFLYTDEFNATTEQLISMADAACYIAKERGRNQIHRYSPDDDSVKRYESELSWLSRINHALQHDRFVLFCQPYQSLSDSTDNLYFEVLIRMLDDNDKILTPNHFLPTAERYNLGDKIDHWVIEHTFQWLHKNPDIQKRIGRCNINLSGQSLANKELKLTILNAFEKYGIPYDKICFEITETMAVVRLEETLDFIKTFRQLGSHFALDDFGSGFSSYSYLKNLPVDCVKIDGSFIRELLRDPVNQAMVTSINDIAKAMKMQTVAEFVEDEATLIQLGKIGVDFAQGYAVSKPIKLNELGIA
jgi:diguanylate cyclase (GGDEF)-like protein/PAS domain S-box-containing protein